MEHRLMTYNEACEYVSRAYEAEGEQRAEFGSGAVSLGYNGTEAMAYYDGYRTSDDPEFALARRIIDEADAAIVRPAPVPPSDDDTIPF
jgi:hypothetical protein